MKTIPGKKSSGCIPGKVGVPVYWERKPDKGLGWSPYWTFPKKLETPHNHAG
ncbi:MAG: hypothetical protein GY699_12495 [Desulfobacteraceae bacterium]|nr:hypothetical protein [Desulfobacteraceae bacterium]